MILQWIFLWIPLIIILYTAITIGVIKIIKKHKIENSVPRIKLIVTNDEVEGFQDFLNFTYGLEEIRDGYEKKVLTEDERNEALMALDEKIKILQESLIYVQSEEGHPNPDVLTKIFFQDLTIQTLVVRLEFEKLMGYPLGQKELDTLDTKTNIIKMYSKNEEDNDA